MGKSDIKLNSLLKAGIFVLVVVWAYSGVSLPGIFTPEIKSARAAITFTNQGASAAPDVNDNVDAISFTTSSWTPPTEGLILVSIFGGGTSGNNDVDNISGNGLTWFEVASVAYGGGTPRVLTLYAANASGATAGTTTITFKGTQVMGVIGFMSADGVDLSGGVLAAFVQAPTNTGTGTGGTVTLAAAADANNRPISMWSRNANEAATAPTWTEADDIAGTSPVHGMETQYRDDAFDTAAAADWTTSVPWGGIAAELKAEAVGGITISGTCTQTNQSTACSDTGGNAVRIAVNGTVQAQTDATVDGSWSISSVTQPSADDIVAIYIEGEAASSSQAVAVTKYSGSGDITGVELMEAHLSIGSNQRNTVTNANLSSGDSGQRTFYDVTSGVLTVDTDSKVSNEELYIKGGNTYQPDSSGGDTVSTDNIEINGTFDLDTNVIAASGSWDNNGRFIANTGSVSFTGNGSETLSNLRATGSFQNGFYHIKLDSSANSGTVTVSDYHVVASGQISIGTGDTLSIASGGKVTHDGATLVLTGTISGAGRFVYRSSTIFPTGGTFSSILVADAINDTVQLPGRAYGGGIEATNNHPSDGGTVQLNSGTVDVTGDFSVISSSALGVAVSGANGNPTINISGNLLFVDTVSGPNTMTAGSGTVTVSGNFDSTGGLYSATMTTSQLVMSGSGKTFTSDGNSVQAKDIKLSGSITLSNHSHVLLGNLDMTGGTITAGTSSVRMASRSASIIGGGNSLYDLNIDPATAGAVTMSTSNLTVSNQLKVAAGDTFAIDASRKLTLSGSGTPLLLFSTSTFSANSSSTVVYSGTSTTNIAPATYGSLSFTPAGTVTYTLGSASAQTFSVNGTFLIGDGSNPVTTDANTYDPAINIFNDFTIADAARYTSGSGTITFKKGGAQTFTKGGEVGTAQNMGEVRVSANGTNTTLTAPNAFVVGSISIDSGQTLVSSGIVPELEITGLSGDVFTLNGTYVPAATGTVTYKDGASNVTPIKYRNLALQGTETHTLPSSGTTVIQGSLILSSGAVVASGTATLFFRGGGTQTLTDSNTVKRNLGEIAVMASTGGSNTTLNLGASVRVSSASVDASQTLDSNGNNTLTITGVTNPFTVNGTFTRSTGAVVFTGGAATNIPALNYYDLKVQPSANSVTHTLLSGTASVSKTFTVGNGTNTGVTVTADTNAAGLDVASVSISANSTLVADGSAELTVAGNWVNNGSFTHTSGTVTFVFTPTSAITGATTFNHLTATQAGKKLKFGAGQTFTFDGTMTITGASGNPIKIESTASASQWLVDFNSAQSAITHATITDSGCAGGSESVTLGTGMTDGSNNGTCWFAAPAPSLLHPQSGGAGPSVGGESGGSGSQGGGQGQGGGEQGEGGGSGGGGSQEGGGEQGGGGGGSPVLWYYLVFR